MQRTAISTLALVVVAACHSTRPAPSIAPEPAAPPARTTTLPAFAPDISPAPRVEPPPETQAVRWLPGLAAVALTDHPAGRGEERLGPAPEDCQSGDTAMQSVTADVAAPDGAETIVASIAHGLVVFAAEGHELARSSLGCGGSGDELSALAVGTVDEIGPVIAVLVTAGGHAEATTRVDLFRVDGDGDTRLDRLFSAPIEVRTGDRTAIGRLELVPGGLEFRKPGGRTTTWSYDAATRTLIRRPR